MTIQINMPSGNCGSLVAEVVRAYLANGCPSALANRLIEGCALAYDQTETAQDRQWIHDFQRKLGDLRDWARKQENARFGLADNDSDAIREGES